MGGFRIEWHTRHKSMQEVGNRWIESGPASEGAGIHPVKADHWLASSFLRAGESVPVR